MARKKATKAARTGPAPSAEPKESSAPKKVKFHYIKGPDFHTVHVDGAIGGITPSGLIHVAFYAERHALPKVTVQALMEGQKLGPELLPERESIGGIVRQMDTDYFLHEEVAKKIRDWLTERLNELEGMRQKQTATEQ